MVPHKFVPIGQDESERWCEVCGQHEQSRFIPESCEGDPRKRDQDFPGPELVTDEVTSGYVDVKIETTDSPGKFEDLFNGCDVELKLKIRGITVEVTGFKAEEVKAQQIQAVQAAGRALFQAFYCQHEKEQ